MSRYARLEGVELIGRAGLAALQQQRVAVIGVGNTGGQVVTHLAMLGVGLLLVDHDEIAEANLGTQGFDERYLGWPKVEARARSLRHLNPDCRVEPVHARIEELGLGVLRDVNLIYGCVDSTAARATINELATRLAVPWLDCAVDGSGRTFTSRVAAYDVTPDSPCFLCAFDREGLRRVMQEPTEGCPRWRPGRAEPVTAPTIAMSAVGGAIAAAQVIWGLKILRGRGAGLFGREIYLDLDENRLTSQALRRNPGCVFDHRRFTFTPIARSVRAMTVGETFAEASARLGGEVVLRLQRGSLATELHCPDCLRVKRPFQLLEALRPRDPRCRCGHVVQPVASALLECFAEDTAAAFLGKTWAALGLPDQDVVTAVRGEREIHLLFAPADSVPAKRARDTGRR